MCADNGKHARLAEVARMYYQRNMTQNQIAQAIGVSRPMVSKLLAEARELGMVQISIAETGGSPELEARLKRIYRLTEASVVQEGAWESGSESAFDKTVMDMLSRLSGGGLLGVGWGKALLRLGAVERMRKSGNFSRVTALAGGVDGRGEEGESWAAAFRLASVLGAEPAAIYLPADCGEDFELFAQTWEYKKAMALWSSLDAVLAEVQPPDAAGAAGSLLGCRFTLSGDLLEEGRRIEAGAKALKSAGAVMALFPQGLPVAAAMGALRTGLISHGVFGPRLAEELLSQ